MRSVPLAWLAFAAIALVWALALPVPAMDVDAAEYAHIAREMLDSGSFLVIHKRGVDYLDKPPLTFWTSALAFAAFGATAWASKLGSYLAALLATFATWRLVKLDASRRAAFLSALFLASSQALFLITNDCRTDTVLLGMVALALWQVRAHQLDGKAKSLVFSGLFVGLAMLAKGPIGAAVPAFAAGSELVLDRRWRRLVSWKPFAVGALALVVLSPMLVGLHRQYGIEGWRFFFWTQSFGRITGSNMWRDDTGPLFFTHTMLWAFLPWTPMLVPALWRMLAELVRARLRPVRGGEAFLAGGFLLTFVALSLSQYKLPHYIFVALPLAAALAGRWADRALDDATVANRLRIAGLVIAVLLAGLAAYLGAFAFAFPPPWVLLLGLALFSGAFAIHARADEVATRVLGPPLAAILGLNVLLAGHFYPSILRYQSGTEAVRIIDERGIPRERVAAFRAREYSLDFGLARDLVEHHKVADIVAAASRGPLWIYTDDEGLRAMLAAPLDFGREVALAEYHVTKLTGRFLSPRTRPGTLQTRYLVEIRGVLPAR